MKSRINIVAWEKFLHFDGTWFEEDFKKLDHNIHSISFKKIPIFYDKSEPKRSKDRFFATYKEEFLIMQIYHFTPTKIKTLENLFKGIQKENLSIPVDCIRTKNQNNDLLDWRVKDIHLTKFRIEKGLVLFKINKIPVNKIYFEVQIEAAGKLIEKII